MWKEVDIVYTGKVTHDMPPWTEKKDGKLKDSSPVGCYTMLTGKLMLLFKDEGITVPLRHQELFTCPHGVTS